MTLSLPWLYSNLVFHVCRFNLLYLQHFPKYYYTGECTLIIAQYKYIQSKLTLGKATQRKSRIQEIKHILTNANSSNDTKKILLITSWSLLYNLLILFSCGDFTPFISQKFQMWDHFFPLLLPNDSKSLKNLDIRLWEVGAKRRWNDISKVNTWTNRQTNRQANKHMDKLTYRQHRLRGPMLWKLLKCPSS